MEKLGLLANQKKVWLASVFLIQFMLSNRRFFTAQRSALSPTHKAAGKGPGHFKSPLNVMTWQREFLRLLKNYRGLTMYTLAYSKSFCFA